MPPTNNVTRMLAAKKVAFEAHELPAEKLGALGTAAYLGVDPAQVFKTIVALPEDGKPLLALVPADAELDLKALGRALGGVKVRTSTQAQAEELTGLKAGGISPLALIGKGFRVVMDESGQAYEKIYLSGGQWGLNLSIAPGDVQALTGARVAKVST